MINSVLKCEIITAVVKLPNVLLDCTSQNIGRNVHTNNSIVTNMAQYYIDEIEDSKYLISHNFYYNDIDQEMTQYIKLIRQLCVDLFLKENNNLLDEVMENNTQEGTIKIIEGTDFKFIENRIILSMLNDFEFKSHFALLFNERESILIKIDCDQTRLKFELNSGINFKKYKIFFIDETGLCKVHFGNPDIVSIEPTILIKDTILKLSYENNNLLLTKAQLKSFVTIQSVQADNDCIFMKLNINDAKIPNKCKLLYIGRDTRQIVEEDVEISKDGKVISKVPIQKLIRERYSDIYVHLTYDTSEMICYLSGKESYFEQIVKFSQKEIAIMTTKQGTVEIEVMKCKSWITKKITNIQYKFIRLLVEKIRLDPKQAVFESYGGRQYSCHPRAIYEYIRVNNPEIKCIWSVEPGCQKNFEQNKIPYVKRFSIRWFFIMAKSKYWISNTRFPSWIQKSKDTIYLQCWHGTPLKRLGTDINEVYMPQTDTFSYNRNFYRESRNWDYLISPNRFSTNVFSRAFHIAPDKIIESGSPRNDFLVLNMFNKDMMNDIKNKFNIPLDKKVILYAPTWRDDQYFSKSKYKFNTALDLEKLKGSLSEEYVIILRTHYLVADNMDLTKYKNFAFNISSGDISELYLISDILITDYSSVYFDFAVLRRSMIFFMYDIDDYRDRLRGFYLDVNNFMPGPIVKTNEELIEEIRKSSHKSEKLLRFLDMFCKLEDGNATKRVCDIVFQRR